MQVRETAMCCAHRRVGRIEHIVLDFTGIVEDGLNTLVFQALGVGGRQYPHHSDTHGRTQYISTNQCQIDNRNRQLNYSTR